MEHPRAAQIRAQIAELEARRDASEDIRVMLSWERQAREQRARLVAERIIFRCMRCKVAWANEYVDGCRWENGRAVGTPNGDDRCVCGRQAKWNTVQGRLSDTPCSSKCTGATGPNCECQCAGANHGRSHMR